MQQLSTLIDIHNPDAVIEEILKTVTMVFPNFDFSTFKKVSDDIIRLFSGRYPGFRRCNVKYHDLDHTMAVTLAVTRLLHGATESGCPLTEKDFNIGMISALMHDTGYIQREGDKEGTGAKYTLTHIGRSIDFIEAYFRDDARYGNEIETFKAILACTGVFLKVREIRFPSANSAILGKILGTGDLLGQMSDRLYLEKLHYLYHEFEEGGVTAFSSPLDLLDKTRGFYQTVLARFAEDFDNVHLHAQQHFRTRWGIDENLYITAIEDNMAHLDHILTHHKDDWRRHLRRHEDQTA
jgi:hypothetical protein